MSRKRKAGGSDDEEDKMWGLMEEEFGKPGKPMSSIGTGDGHLIHGDEGAFRIYKSAMEGLHQNCLWCEQANFTDPSFHSKLDEIRKNGVQMYESGKNKEQVYADIAEMYRKHIYEPIRSQEKIQEQRGIPIKNPVREWTISSITYHFEKDEINPIQKINNLSLQAESIIDNIRFMASKDKDPLSGVVSYTEKQVDMFSKLSSIIHKCQTTIFTMQKQNAK